MRRHAESRKENKRAKPAQDDEVRQLLQYIVMFRVLPFGKTLLQMLPDRMTDLSQIRLRGQEVAEMAAQYREQHVHCPIRDKDPSDEKMPTPSHRQPLAFGQRRPGRKASDFHQRSLKTRGIAPIERRMGVEDLQPAH